MSNNEERNANEIKVNCPCGSMVFQKNMNSHMKTKKHQLVCGTLEQYAVAKGAVPSKPERSKSASRGKSTSGKHEVRPKEVNFAAAQKTQRAEVDDDELEEEEEEILSDEYEGDEASFEDDVMDALEDIGKELQSQNSSHVGLRNVVLDIRSKLETLLAMVADISAHSAGVAAQLGKLSSPKEEVVQAQSKAS